MRNRQIADFISTVEALPTAVTEFKPELWGALVDCVTVYGKNDIRFTLNNGAEVKV